MALFTGFAGHVSTGTSGGGGETKVPQCRKWSVNESADVKSVIDSSTMNAEVAVPGNKDWSGTYDAYGAIPIVMPGDLFEFEGAATGVGASALGGKGDAMCEGVTIKIPVESGEPVNHSVKFGAMGVWTPGVITCPEDDTIPDYLDPRSLIVEVASDPFSSFSSLHGVRDVTIELSRKTQSPVVSGIKTRAKGALSGTLNITTYEPDTNPWAALAPPNTVLSVRCYVTATTFWLFRWMMVQGRGPQGADIEGQAIVDGGLNFKLCTATRVSAVPTRGTIIKPDLSVYFP